LNKTKVCWQMSIIDGTSNERTRFHTKFPSVIICIILILLNNLTRSKFYLTTKYVMIKLLN